MNEYITVIVAFLICTSSALQSYPLQTTSIDAESSGSPVIVALDKPMVTDTSLVWHYQIRNDSAEDIGICDRMGTASYRAYLAKDNETLLIQRHHPSYFFGGVWVFLESAEHNSPNRSEWTAIPYTFQTLKGERLLRVTADGLRIPYLEDQRLIRQPGLRYCTRIEMKFRPSPLEFFFLYTDEQSLLSPAEKQCLRSLGTVTITAPNLLRAFADDVAKGLCWEAFATEHGVAELTCYRGEEHLMALTVYDGVKIVNEEGQVFRFGQRLPSLRKFTPQIQPFDLRVQCASHPEALWHRSQVCRKMKVEVRPKRWCDDIVDACKNHGGWPHESCMSAFKCPSQTRGKCHYAMNPDCRADSPADTVLPFETKAGWIRWNRHGDAKVVHFRQS